MEFRHELKFIVSDAQIEQIRYRIKWLMQTDRNQYGDFYTITSLYFDDVYDRCLQENMDGVDRRSKYRMRIYNNDLKCIKLEKKSKVRGMTRKEAATLTREESSLLMKGQYPYADYSVPKKLSLLCQMQMLGMQPKSIVEYDRTAFVCPIGNVRITFDRNIRGTLKVSDFNKSKILMTPLMNMGSHILEVKYDELLPEYIYNALEIATLQQTSFSKYAYSRQL